MRRARYAEWAQGDELPHARCKVRRLILLNRGLVHADCHNAGAIHACPCRLDNFDEDKAHIGMERLVLRQMVDPAEDARARSARKEVMFRARRTVTFD